ncbi:peptide-methionine (S)-S-oxide reductase MsrA [Testudinibacter sp. TR-2022]|uniref:peptide-methionine (S)-S-oxide reductase MsrA n=1 Tax=Testudinibacter sp. TR-2022 TaxID=2585029 RepID=UPI0011186CE4|nr:peptide-methionine (S)-S-oxide reductase MsrA [Testudinibacter sp. TR-2022]TNH02923.1 peptide-methionine (S)-S-oxide reductase MsrA [Pasteurellaceae bacterium Phil31]TNH09103.1 peptide-methionine (S)-S-oxide reductase MsrA [Testudinibacter sp. TR-2022]TNH11283.1 peptide-methionine (S)-S-oxide reductase MsrA [Testudinibacter sp. TR-2022]TNH13780.1 peptide-methionine (S)-S-oxide reductase MsrA [Testudinibacter sp. TR-2022]TNH14400.1 peptide-methionine (S)-S-oxide reductase MsrA [Testudinibact
MMQTAIFAGGCFWCIEAVYNQIQGVQSAVSGYIGGHLVDPSYRQVCDSDTGHAEAVKIEFDPQQISYQTLLAIFFAIHNPTELNRQDHDVGTQYRSEIFYLNDQQKQLAEQTIAELQPHFSAPIVTKISPATTFYPAEAYHQGYFLQNPNTGYCSMVVAPKYLKAKVKFAELWKTDL